MPTAIAIAAHPDDIEFCMAGTLLLLKEAGYETHYLNLSSGNLGSVEYDAVETRFIRRQEAQRAAKLLGAHFHPSLTDDLEILYERDILHRIAAIIREVRPEILLTHSPQDYMEDHTNTCRLAVTAAFARGMPNFIAIPSRKAIEQDLTVYHAMPHGLADPLRGKIIPGSFVNTTSVHQIKMEALSAHKSQAGWLDVSQGMNSYLLAMEDMSVEVGRLSRKFKQAEGWRRHSHLGFCAYYADPMKKALGKNYLINQAYERALERGE